MEIYEGAKTPFHFLLNRSNYSGSEADGVIEGGSVVAPHRVNWLYFLVDKWAF